MLGLTPVLNQLSSHGTGSTVLGLYLALNVNWMVLSLPLAWSYRIVAPDPPSWKVAMAGGFTTGAFVSGFLQGFVLFLSLPIDLGSPFGGATAVGAVSAVLLWMWVLHLGALYGYVATRAVSRLLAGGADADAQDVGGRDAGRPDADPAHAGSSRVVGGGV